MGKFQQIQMRGGSTDEHKEFIGAPREVTIDTTENTLRVHDGVFQGGHIICKQSELIQLQNDVNKKFEDFENNMGGTHSHDDRYAKLTHLHNDYIKKINNCGNVYSKYINNYEGICFTNSHGEAIDSGWFRTTKSGILPYQSGTYSSVGSASWRFAEGWFGNINSRTIDTDSITIGKDKNEQYSGIRFASKGSNKRIEYDAVGDRLYVAGTKTQTNGLSDMEATVFKSTDYAMVGGTRLYIQPTDPGNVPNGSVWIKI